MWQYLQISLSSGEINKNKINAWGKACLRNQLCFAAFALKAFASLDGSSNPPVQTAKRLLSFGLQRGEGTISALNSGALGTPPAQPCYWTTGKRWLMGQGGAGETPLVKRLKAFVKKTQQPSLGSVTCRWAASTWSYRWGNQCCYQLATMAPAGVHGSPCSHSCGLFWGQRKRGRKGTFSIFPGMTKISSSKQTSDTMAYNDLPCCSAVVKLLLRYLLLC